MGGLKICVIGGGSTYTPELIEGFTETEDELPVAAIALMDIGENRLRVVGGLAERMLRAAEADIELRLTTQRKEALEGADYVITQIRVGGLACRIQDEKIPLQFGVVGQETTGPGGFAKALRTIPVLLDIARGMAEVAPEAHAVRGGERSFRGVWPLCGEGVRHVKGRDHWSRIAQHSLGRSPS